MPRLAANTAPNLDELYAHARSAPGGGGASWAAYMKARDPWLARHALRLCNKPSRKIPDYWEDATNETWARLRAGKGRDGPREGFDFDLPESRQEFERTLRSILDNICKAEARRRKKAATTVDTQPHDFPRPRPPRVEESVTAKVDLERLWSRLSAVARSTLSLVALGHTQSEAAEKAEVTVTTFKVRKRRARNDARAAYDEQED